MMRTKLLTSLVLILLIFLSYAQTSYAQGPVFQEIQSIPTNANQVTIHLLPLDRPIQRLSTSNSPDLPIQAEQSEQLRFTFNIDAKLYQAPLPGYGSTPPISSTINVGSAIVGATTSTTLTVQETGDATLDVIVPVTIPGQGPLSGPHPGDFSLVNGPPFKIFDGGADHPITIQCIPSVPGTRTAILTFNTNDPSHPIVSYTLTCTSGSAPAPPRDDSDDEDDDDDDDTPPAAPPPAIPDQIFDCWPWEVILPPLGIPHASSHCLPSLGAPLPAASTFLYLGHSVEVTINDAAGMPVIQFNPPLKICFRYTQAELDALGGDPQQFLIQTFRDGTWESMPTSLEGDPSPTVLGRVCAPVDHLTLFALFNREKTPLASVSTAEDATATNLSADNPLASVEFLPETGEWSIPTPWLWLVLGLTLVGGMILVITRHGH